MPRFSSTRRVNHSAQKMYALIADVEHYPQFLPLCEALVIKSREERNGRKILIADMTVAYKFVRETYGSRVMLDEERKRVFVEAISGPFRKLDNRWTIREVDEHSCDVEFYIDYEFKSRTLQLLMGSMFDYAFGKFSDAFVERADAFYGRSD
ncbi:MAG: SRPBCC family protein [Hyphomicrobiaceae bacterium]|nr:SRPBCC family protein [Hyphomicrobiaceae bacterium]